MLTVNNLSVIFPDKKLFEDVNLIFNPGNCYGVIGANVLGNLHSSKFYPEKKSLQKAMSR